MPHWPIRLSSISCWNWYSKNCLHENSIWMIVKHPIWWQMSEIPTFVNEADAWHFSANRLIILGWNIRGVVWVCLLKQSTEGIHAISIKTMQLNHRNSLNIHICCDIGIPDIRHYWWIWMLVIISWFIHIQWILFESWTFIFNAWMWLCIPYSKSWMWLALGHSGWSLTFNIHLQQVE